jgi:hypothetical protein
LSRVKSLEGLFLLGINYDKITCNEKVIKYYTNLERDDDDDGVIGVTGVIGITGITGITDIDDVGIDDDVGIITDDAVKIKESKPHAKKKHKPQYEIDEIPSMEFNIESIPKFSSCMI